jgi:(1->4)-alpha-D-glucan 1-alpha-D-glucosylmutase
MPVSDREFQFMTLSTAVRPDIATIVAAVVADRRALPPPRATYRLQLNHTFTFRDATAIVPYLAHLGISHLYASPVFQAAAGSLHGYDVVDYGQLNAEIGTPEDFAALVATLHAHDMRLVVDFVPNHMGIDQGQNAWWQDVIEHGQLSRFAGTFDIDWSPIKRELTGKVLLPFLGDQYGDVLERGELVLAFADGGFSIRYWESSFPLDPRTWPVILQPVLDDLATEMPDDHIDVLELASIITALEFLPSAQDADLPDDAVDRRYREYLVCRHRLSTLVERSPRIGELLAQAITTANGTPGDARSFDLLDELLNRQSFRLAFWRVAAEEINYRRFFAINTLAAIRQEEPSVFAATHQLLLDLIADGAVDGVRIDHPDGLLDPAQYFMDLQAATLRVLVQRRLGLSADEPGWDDLRPEVDAAIAAELAAIATGDRQWPLFVVAEKILEHGEELPREWAIAGTVGYEFAQATTGLFVDPDARMLFDRIYSRFSGDRTRFPDLVYEMKQRMMREAFPSEVNVLTNVLDRISDRDRHSRDFTVNNLRSALREVMACFQVYRTYTTCHESEVTERDVRAIQAAVAQARRRNRAIDPSVFSFIEGVLLLETSDDPHERRAQRCHFAMKLQQLTGPVMAKGLEDTAFYRFNRLVSLNEVGGDPSRFGTSADEFHRQNRARLRDWPTALLTSSTHDTKRSEDVRARISPLSEVPTDWRAAINRWTRLNRKLKVMIDGALAPQRGDEYVIYQTLIGTWPLGEMDADGRRTYGNRLAEYIIKVAREADRVTSWSNPDEAYETALTNFVKGLLERRRSRAFVDDFSAFVAVIRPAGLTNALAQQVLKLMSPGIPDLYQGTELWDDSLVDPDNRRPVDFSSRTTQLQRSADDAGFDDPTGWAKLFVSQQLLRLRANLPELFATGDYIPLNAEGTAGNHVVAFLRRSEDTSVLVVVPRLALKLERERKGENPWADTQLPLPATMHQYRWRNALEPSGRTLTTDDGQLSMAELFTSLPVAVLVADDTEETA